MIKEYLRRFSVCITGLALYGLGNAFGVLAGSAGTNAWNTLNIGLADRLGFSFGVQETDLRPKHSHQKKM